MSRGVASLIVDLAGLALVSVVLAALLLPAFAIANGSFDLASWPPSSRQAFPIMSGTFFVTLGLADLATGAGR